MKSSVEAELEYTILKVFAQKIYRECYVDSKPKFKVAYDDPEAGTYAVTSTSFIDADRAGFSDDVTETVFKGLSQIEADYAVKLLNEAGKK